MRELEEIIATLKKALNDLEVVFEFLEEAEIQKTATDKEIESLKRALRQLHRPRDHGPSHSPPTRAEPAPPSQSG